MALFKGPLSKFREKVDMRYYTTAEPFLKDLRTLIGDVISTEPMVRVESLDIEKPSPVKKPVFGLKERKQLAKRIIRSAQKLLNDAIDQDANYTAKPVQGARDELTALLEGNFPLRAEPTIMSLVGSGSFSIGESDVGYFNQNGSVQISRRQADNYESNQDTTIDVEMADESQIVKDPKASSEVGDVMIVDSEPLKDSTGGDSITTAALAEVTGNVSPMKSSQSNGVKNSITPPDTVGYASAPDREHEAEAETNTEAGAGAEEEAGGPPTPPVSNGDTNADQTRNILIDGGVPPFLLEDFEIDGTQISEKESSKRKAEESLSDVLSDMDDDLVNGLQQGILDVEEVVAAAVSNTKAPAVKSKKGKAKKRRR